MAVAKPLNPRIQAITGLALPVISGALVMVALVGHLHALKRVAGTAVPLPVVALQSLGLALWHAVPAAFMATVDARVHWMSAGIFVMAAITLHTLRPMRRPWGARLISAMMVLALVSRAHAWSRLRCTFTPQRARSTGCSRRCMWRRC